LVELMALTDVC